MGGWGEATGTAPGTAPPKVGFQRLLADRARIEGVGVGSGEGEVRFGLMGVAHDSSAR